VPESGPEKYSINVSYFYPMKFIYSLLVLTSISLSLSAQVKVSGKIEGGSGKVSLVPDSRFGQFDAIIGETELYGEAFSISVPMTQPGELTLAWGDFNVQFFAAPGDEISFEATASQFPLDMTFTGKTAQTQELLKKFDEKFGTDFDSATIASRVLDNQLDFFETQIYENLTAQKKFCQDAFAKNEYGEVFKTWMNTQVRFHYLSQLIGYPLQRASASHATTVKNLPEIMMEVIQPEFAAADASLNSFEFRSFLKHYTWYLIYAQNGFTQFVDASDALLKARAYSYSNHSEVTKAWFHTQALLDNGNHANVATLKLLYKDIAQGNAKSQEAQLVMRHCGEHMDDKPMTANKGDDEITSNGGTRKGGTEGAFHMETAEGKPVSFDDFKGKVIYVDFWASWCGPCRAQAPFAIELKEKFTEAERKKIVFLYISIDQDAEAWKSAVEKLNLDGIQTISDPNAPNGASSYFQISSIPRYMIVDPSGKIVNPNAPRPGDPAIYDILKKLIN
jgi:thiol-disulfide isomerase/thioredoxin